MCGITACVGFGKDAGRLLKIMNDAQAHRGPDGEGMYVDGQYGIAQRSLAIIDRAHGQQPMPNADGNLVIAYNGEIYNYRELRAELEPLGLRFNNHTDTEVAMQAYAEWGDKAFDRFNGMFAFALYDKRQKRLVAARDHFGIKPLYYINLGTVKQPKLLFASEIRTLLATKEFKPEPNERQIYRYLRYRIHEDESETFFKGVHKLLPGEVMTVDGKGLRIERYTDLPERLLRLAGERKAYTEEAVDEYRERLTHAIRMRLVSEVPVGSCLSGGLDSSTTVLTINRLLEEHDLEAESVGAKQNTFSAVFPGSLNDEERYIDAALAKCQGYVASHKVRPTPQTFLADMHDFILTQEEPTISTGPYAQYKVMEEAHKYVTVLLDGQGADEMLAGYYPYYFVYLRQLRRTGEWLKLLTESLRSSDVLFRFLRFRVYDKLRLRHGVPTASFLSADFRKAHSHEKFEIVQDDLKKRFVEDIFKNSLPSLLRYEDKNTMRFSIEGRVPFLDKDVMEYLFSLDDSSIIRGSWNKRILRDSTAGLLPDLIRTRRNKIGFTTPETEWFKHLQTHFYEIFTSESFARRTYFNQGAIVGAFQELMRGRSAVDTMVFWRLLNVELWLREFIDSAQGANEARPPKPDRQPNPGKQRDITAAGKTYARYPLQTQAVRAGDELAPLITSRVAQFLTAMPAQDPSRPWDLFVSEKIVAITQGRSYFIWDVKPSVWARALSRFVVRTPYGIGLGSPWTMQLAIELAGLPRILFAAAGSAIGKAAGKRGTFYNLVGSDVRAIDGPTEYSVYPSNVSAKLPPKEPTKVAVELSEAIRDILPAGARKSFKGVVIMDANDLGRNVLGHNTELAAKDLAAIFADNPLGQGSERTPLCVVVEA